MTEKLAGQTIDGVARIEIEGAGSVIIETSNVRVAGDEEPEADVTLSADSDILQEILAGDLNATSAFMNGSLKVRGDMGLAMKLGNLLV